MMQQPPGGGGAGGNGEVPIAPPTGQMSREAKHMRVMLMLCVKEKIFDQNALEVIFNQWIQCEQQNDGHVEETDAAFRRSIGRMYGPKSKDFLNAIDRAKVKLEQLKERKSKGELGTGPLVGGSMPGPPSNAPMQGIPNGQPHSLQNLGNPQSMQHIQQQQQQHHIPQQQSQQLLSQPQSQQLLAQQQLQQTPQVMQQYYKPQPNVAMTGQPLPHIQQTQQFQQTQPSYKLPSNITQNLPSGSVQSLPHHNQPIQPMIVNQTSITYDNRPPTMMNPTPPEMRPLPNMNPIPVPHNSQSMDQHGRVAPPIAAPIVESVDEDNIKQEDQKKKGGGRKKPPEEGEEGKRKKDAKKPKGKGADAAEKEAPKVVGTVGGLPFLEVKQPVNVSPSTGDELDNLTEKPNLLQEGLQATDRGIMTGYIIDGGLLIKEETTSRQMMRDNIAIGEKLDSSPDRIEFEPFMEKNVVGKDILDHAMQTVLNMKMDINPESRKLLSDGIQSHLRTIVEGALDISRKRLNRTACGNFYDSFQHFKQNNGAVSEHHLSNVAIKWGPNVAGILSEEEAKLKQFYKDYCDIDEEKLKEKMKLFDEERSKAAGMKRKIGNVAVEVETQSTWWEKDQSFEDEGILSYEKIAEVWKKNDIAAKHELGPNIKRRSQKKVETPLPDSTNDLLATAQRTNNDSSVPMDTEDLRSSEIEWRNQTCPISIPPDTYVTSDDIYFVISKVNSRKGGLIGSRADREKIRKTRFQWKLFAR